jgi:hypothetical protein
MGQAIGVERIFFQELVIVFVGMREDDVAIGEQTSGGVSNGCSCDEAGSKTDRESRTHFVGRGRIECAGNEDSANAANESAQDSACAVVCAANDPYGIDQTVINESERGLIPVLIRISKDQPFGVNGDESAAGVGAVGKCDGDGGGLYYGRARGKQKKKNRKECERSLFWQYILCAGRNYKYAHKMPYSLCV